jgi:hypothetical protein
MNTHLATAHSKPPAWLAIVFALSFPGFNAVAATVFPPTHLYWTEQSREFGGTLLRRSDLNGNGVVTLRRDDDLYIRDMMIDDIRRQIYWVAYEDDLVKIQRVNLNGSNPQDLYVLPEGNTFFDSVALDLAAQKVYWTEANFGTSAFRIRRSNLDGTFPETVRTTEGRAIQLELDLLRGQMYWIEESVDRFYYRLRRGSFDESAYQTLNESIWPMNLALDTRRFRAYFVSYGLSQIFTSSQDGGPLTTMFEGSSDLQGPIDLAVDARAQIMIWPNSNANTIQRSGLFGSSGQPVTLHRNLNDPEVVALGPIPEPSTGLLAAFAALFALWFRNNRPTNMR